MRNILIPLGTWVGLAACSGTAVVDGGSGGTSSSGNTTSTTTSTGTTGPNASSSSTGPVDCSSLGAALVDALGEAMRCDACTDGPDPCEYLSGQQLTDTCGCPVPVNINSPDAVAAAVAIYQQWIGAGCGPLECGTPCEVSSEPGCQGIGSACEGACAP